MTDQNRLPAGWTVERIRAAGAGSDVEALAADQFTLFVENNNDLEEIAFDVIIRCGDLYLLRSTEDGGWYMGQLADPGVIVTWGNYGRDLEGAIRNL